METWKRSKSDIWFDRINVLFWIIVLFIVIYPLYFILIASFSNPDLVNAGQVWFMPKELAIEGYMRILENDQIWVGYRNTIIYTIVSTVISVVLLLTGGYALSRKDLAGRNVIMMLIAFTMFFGGGLIPTYLLVKSLGMLDTLWALVIPNAVGVYQLIICRTFFQSTIPDELLEAAVMDGCNNTRFFLRIVLPLSTPIIAVMILFRAVSEWNAYFDALIYIRDQAKQPLQIILRDILIQAQADGNMLDSSSAAEQQKLSEQIKYGVVIVASLPVLVLYPFLQRYFVKGVMIGSIKG
ncbi:carbohydrate ABC transporter permease [Paenibacillus sp. F411]|uniref:carbohydrate ABC transporter permease n=1 Tax=Paenibacillus sp. F411 TaxID=2820239 RepID=UPI001AAF863C|nr:carbohydrate ABC transporter permease [Paenibacillus sp. F411]MBO2944372.1 carbohydrate ABC transporter permease [Paenibacillus sp. F411]